LQTNHELLHQQVINKPCHNYHRLFLSPTHTTSITNCVKSSNSDHENYPFLDLHHKSPQWPKVINLFKKLNILHAQLANTTYILPSKGPINSRILVRRCKNNQNQINGLSIWIFDNYINKMLSLSQHVKVELKTFKPKRLEWNYWKTRCSDMNELYFCPQARNAKINET
jgi:hypothetical protein